MFLIFQFLRLYLFINFQAILSYFIRIYHFLIILNFIKFFHFVKYFIIVKDLICQSGSDLPIILIYHFHIIDSLIVGKVVYFFRISSYNLFFNLHFISNAIKVFILIFLVQFLIKFSNFIHIYLLNFNSIILLNLLFVIFISLIILYIHNYLILILHIIKFLLWRLTHDFFICINLIFILFWNFLPIGYCYQIIIYYFSFSKIHFRSKFQYHVFLHLIIFPLIFFPIKIDFLLIII